MTTDPWTYRRDVDASRVRQAAAMVGWLVPGVVAMEIEGAAVVVTLPRPPFDFLGLRKRSIARGAIGRCAELVPPVLGWCPEVRIEWDR